ncbi:hypothetical protein [Thomasclavelia sp.]|uniref:hypothetical protein n=1 Tax=Thomasclavelia sp. TaxID=3025757 RepID=UPI00262D5261|nr:hypothetical protein [Thomasclavelia sp.]
MVSKLEILQRFYQIYLDCENDYFTYRGKQYYLCQINNFTNYYEEYIHALNLIGFQVVYNCFNRPISMNYILYTYQNEQYDLEHFIMQSLRPLNQKINILKIKESWCKILDEAKNKIGNHASRINHFEHFIVLSYYYQGMGECAINILNQIKRKELLLGVEHFAFEDCYEILCAPDNLVLASRIKDLSTAYKNKLITISQLEDYVNYAKLLDDELIYLYARLLFPEIFFKNVIKEDCNDSLMKKKLLNIYQNIDNEKRMIKIAYQMLCNYVNIPYIPWL